MSPRGVALTIGSLAKATGVTTLMVRLLRGDMAASGAGSHVGRAAQLRSRRRRPPYLHQAVSQLWIWNRTGAHAARAVSQRHARLRRDA